MTRCRCEDVESGHEEGCPILRHETDEATALGQRLFELLRGASRPRVAASALHVAINRLAHAMASTPTALVETMLRISRELEGPPS